MLICSAVVADHPPDGRFGSNASEALRAKIEQWSLFP
jgi:hypothetical protein